MGREVVKLILGLLRAVRLVSILAYMRFSDIILMLAEVKAALGDDASAKQYLSMVRNRAFASTSEANVDALSVNVVLYWMLSSKNVSWSLVVRYPSVMI